jgi:hypothetical protein
MTKVTPVATLVCILASTLGQAPSVSVAPSFSKDVAPILYRRCTSCHRPGENAPMSLLTYEEARPFARAIRRMVTSREMPPWFAAPLARRFRNERRLTDDEIDVIARWVNAGAIEGRRSDLPPPPAVTEGWAIGTPDAVLTMPEPYQVPADGAVEYQHFQMPAFAEDKWVQAVELRPGNRTLVHHAMAFVTEPGPKRTGALQFRDDLSAGDELPIIHGMPTDMGALLVTHAPGTEPLVFPAGTAMKVRAGATLTFEIHYTPNGTAGVDRSSVGFIFAKQPPVEEIINSGFDNQVMRIPAGAANHRVDAEVTFTQDVKLWALWPHMHLRGKSWAHELVYPDGRTESVLSVPHYDFNWQTYYVFERPIDVPKGSRLRSIAHFDNSRGNAANPNPDVEVGYGPQTWDEMQYTGITYSIRVGGPLVSRPAVRAPASPAPGRDH